MIKLPWSHRCSKVVGVHEDVDGAVEGGWDDVVSTRVEADAWPQVQGHHRVVVDVQKSYLKQQSLYIYIYENIHGA